MSVFSERLKQIMDERGVTQISLSEMTGIPKSAVSQYLSDRFKPKRDRTYIICRALNIDPAWLMGLSNDKFAFDNDIKREFLTSDELRLVNFCREHPEMKEFIMKLIDENSLSNAAFRAAKSEDGSVAPICEPIAIERKKRLLEAPETQEDI